MNSNQRIILVVMVVVLVGASATIALYELSKTPGQSRPLPSGCVKPADGFLIVASNTGYNDSIGHGAPTKAWPILSVHQGQTVDIVVCNVDVQAHGFQITHYFDGNQLTIQPGQVLHIPAFVADQTGSFIIYCDIFCSIHIYMQNGLLNVTA